MQRTQLIDARRAQRTAGGRTPDGTDTTVPRAARVADPASPARPTRGLQLLIEGEARCARSAASSAPGSSSAGSSAPDWPTLVLPAGLAHLCLDQRPVALVASAPRGPAITFEVLDGRPNPRVVALCPADRQLRLNGRPAPPLVLLRIGDELQLEGLSLHLTEFLGGGAELLPAHREGAPCGLCRQPISATTPVIICTCNEVLHLEEAPGLDCAAQGDCPTCERPLQLEGGWAWTPEV